MKRHLFPFPLLLAAFLAFAATSGFADRAEDCEKIREAGADTIAKAEEINSKIIFLKEEDRAGNHKAIQKLRNDFRRLRNYFLDLKAHYSRMPVPCGSGDLEEDIERKFPEME